MESSDRSVRVVKVGGSLFDHADLSAALRRFLDAQSPAASVLIAGGGPWADAIREVDSRSPIGERVAHDLCVHAMGITARLVAALAPQCPLETNWNRLLAWIRTPDCDRGERVFDTAGFLADVEPQSRGPVLPHDWSVTSDSIAARVAGVLEAAELVVLKSTALSQRTSMEQAAADGYVDRFFPRVARGLPRVRCVNLREPEFSETIWSRRTPVGS